MSKPSEFWSVARFVNHGVNRRRDAWKSRGKPIYRVFSPSRLSVADDVLVLRQDGTSKTVRILDSGRSFRQDCTDGQVDGWEHSFANLNSARARAIITGVVEFLPSLPKQKTVARRKKRRPRDTGMRAMAIKPPAKRCHGGLSERDANGRASRTPGGEPYECPYGDHWHVRASPK